jgi:hypothetical protein
MSLSTEEVADPLAGFDLVAAFEAEVGAQIADPYPTYRDLLQRGSVFRGDMLTEHLGFDPPEHFTHRRLVQAAFSKRTTERWQSETAQPLVEERLSDDFVARGSAELMREFCITYPISVIHHILGLPRENLSQVHQWAIGLLLYRSHLEIAQVCAQRLGELVAEHIRIRRCEPGDDVISALCRAELPTGERLTDEEIVTFLRVFSERRKRDHNERARQPVRPSAPQPGPARPGALRSHVHRTRRRGDPAAGAVARRHVAGLCCGLRARRRRHPRGLTDLRRDRRRQPRPGALPRSRPVRHHPKGVRLVRVRPRPAHLPRPARRPHGDGDRAHDVPRPATEPQARRRCAPQRAWGDVPVAYASAGAMGRAVTGRRR